MTTLAEFLTSDPEYDEMKTTELMAAAVRAPSGERARALMALSRRIDASLLPRYLEILEDSRSGDSVVSILTVRLAGLVALLVNTQGEPRAIAERLWMQLPEADRAELRLWLGREGVELP
jgi:hypothetical protein